MLPARRSSRVWPLVIVAVGTALQVPGLGRPPYGEHGFRQAQTLFAVQGYVERGIDLGRAYLPVFGPQQNLPFELPLFQAVAALVSGLGVGVDLATRVVALSAFQAAAVLLWLLLRRWHGPTAAIVALVVFELAPFGLHWAAVPLIDFFSVALGLGMVAAAGVWLRERRAVALGTAAVLAVLVLLVKVTTFPTVGVLLLLDAVLAAEVVGRRKALRRTAAVLVAGPCVGLVGLVLWTRYADAVKERSPLTEGLTSSALKAWNFGSASQRGDASVYVTIVMRVADHLAGPGLVALVLAVTATLVLGRRHEHVLVTGLLLAVVVSPLIFLNLYYVHSYYLIAIYPVVVAAVAVGIATATERLARPTSRALVAGVGCAAVLLVLAVTPGGGADLSTVVRPDTSAPSVVEEVDRVTRPGDRILVVGCDWNPMLAYLAQRPVLMLVAPQTPEFWRSTGAPYEFVVACRGVDVEAWLPPGTQVAPTGEPDVWALSPR